MATAPKKKTSDKATSDTSDEPTSSQFHGELQNTDAANFSGGNTTAPVHNDTPQANGFDASTAKQDEDK